MDNSMSRRESKFATETKRFGNLQRNLFEQTRRLSSKILRSDKKPSNPGSTPECNKRDSTKPSKRKSFVKKVNSVLKKKSMRKNTRTEKRFDAYNKMRSIPILRLSFEETFSIGSKCMTGATYDLERSDASYKSEILDFQAEVNECQGLVEISVNSGENVENFVKLCEVKESNCPFEDKAQTTTLLVPYHNGNSPRSFETGGQNLSPLSAHSNFSSNSATRMSSHCARTCWNQQKIPMLTTYTAEKRSFDLHSQNSSGQHHSTALMTTMRSLHTSVTVGWNDLPSFIRYYLVSITACFLAIIHWQFSR